MISDDLPPNPESSPGSDEPVVDSARETSSAPADAAVRPRRRAVRPAPAASGETEPPAETPARPRRTRQKVQPADTAAETAPAEPAASPPEPRPRRRRTPVKAAENASASAEQ